MKFPNGNIRTLTIVCTVIIIGIIFYFFISGVIPRLITHMEKGTITKNTTSTVPLMIDADFEIKEVNVSIVKYINITQVTYEDMQMYPELESYMHGVNNDPDAWYRGRRYMNTFQGNLSTYDTLVKKICKGKSIFECNHGSLFGYHNQYYHVSYQQYGTHPQ